ncbi:MAG: DUF3152 domain-containing protein [Hamadaea sp.]|nr:DUF3152 domain-containing protein [Hamadaea sp.]
MKIRIVAAVVAAGAALLAAGLAGVGPWKPEPARYAQVIPSAQASPSTVASPSTSPSASPSPAGPILRLAGPVQATGPGTFVKAAGAGPMLGSAGRLRRFHVAVESNVAADELAEFTQTVERTLADTRSWIGAGQHRFQRVPAAVAADFTIHLATRQTAYRMCRAGGVDIRVGGVPYTSCRRFRGVIVNLDRWRLSARPFVEAHVPLETYRAYVINHEVGHELGRGHVGCPAAGRPAPVMLPQTLGLRGCRANPWPFFTRRA